MQLKYHMVTIEDLMPQDHFLRKLKAALDLSFVYEETARLYNRKLGHPPIGPVVIVKYLLVGFLYGIPSERQIGQRNLERRYSPEYREALKLRQIRCEGTFAAQKRGRNLTRVLRRGIEAAKDRCLLSAAAMNLKRMIRYAK